MLKGHARLTETESGLTCVGEWGGWVGEWVRVRMVGMGQGVWVGGVGGGEGGAQSAGSGGGFRTTGREHSSRYTATL